MTRTLTLYQGADMDPSWDYSDWVEWPDCDFGIRCYNGEAAQSEFRLRDVRGETGNFANLPGDLTYRGISAHNVMPGMANAMSPNTRKGTAASQRMVLIMRARFSARCFGVGGGR